MLADWADVCCWSGWNNVRKIIGLCKCRSKGTRKSLLRIKWHRRFLLAGEWIGEKRRFNSELVKSLGERNAIDRRLDRGGVEYPRGYVIVIDNREEDVYLEERKMNWFRKKIPLGMNGSLISSFLFFSLDLIFFSARVSSTENRWNFSLSFSCPLSIDRMQMPSVKYLICWLGQQQNRASHRTIVHPRFFAEVRRFTSIKNPADGSLVSFRNSRR